MTGTQVRGFALIGMLEFWNIGIMGSRLTKRMAAKSIVITINYRNSDTSK